MKIPQIRLFSKIFQYILEHLFSRNNNTLIIWLSLIVGTLAGIASAVFHIGIEVVMAWRLDLNAYFANGEFPLWLIAIPISATMVGIAFYITHRYAPEAGGSGIPEIEGAMEEMRPVRWKRVIPVKFFGGLMALGSGMALGREGPSVQLGANIGRMISDLFKMNKADGQALLASGAAAGLAAAFNAPLAGIMFVIEEMRSQFKYNLTSTKCVFLAAVIATMVMRFVLENQGAVVDVVQYDDPALGSLWLYLILGFCFGVLGVLMNKMTLWTQDMFLSIHKNERWKFVSVGIFLGAVFGALSIIEPDLAYSGLHIIPQISGGHYLAGGLFFIFMFRILTTLLSFSSGAPGGVFAPTLALGTLFGMLFGIGAHMLFPELVTEPGAFAIAGMGGLFAATVRAPITGILLVIEMTSNYHMILPLILTCLGATMVAQALGGRPLYTQLLERTLKLAMRRKREEARRRAMFRLSMNKFKIESNTDKKS